MLAMDPEAGTAGAQQALQTLLLQALNSDGGAPLLEAAETLMKAAVRAAQLYPEWARSIAADTNPAVDRIAEHLAGSSSV